MPRSKVLKFPKTLTKSPRATLINCPRSQLTNDPINLELNIYLDNQTEAFVECRSPLPSFDVWDLTSPDACTATGKEISVATQRTILSGRCAPGICVSLGYFMD